MPRLATYLLFGLLLNTTFLAEAQIHYVIDDSDVLDSLQLRQLTAQLSAFEQETGAQMAIVLDDKVPEGQTALQAATQMASKLGVGHKNVNNGLLLHLFLEDRQLSLVTGYGTQWIVTNAEAQAIIDGMAVHLRANDLSRALASAVEACAEQMRQQNWEAKTYTDQSDIQLGTILHVKKYEYIPTLPPVLIFTDGTSVTLELQEAHKALLPKLEKGEAWIRISQEEIPLKGQLLGVD